MDSLDFWICVGLMAGFFCVLGILGEIAQAWWESLTPSEKRKIKRMAGKI